MMLLCTTYTTHYYTEWNFRFTQLSLVGTVCWLLPHSYYSLRTISIAPPKPQGIIVFLNLDYFITTTLGLLRFAFPQCLLRIVTQVKPNGVSVTLAKVNGALLVCFGFESQAASMHTQLTSKKSVHLSRLLACAALSFLVLCASSQRPDFNDTHRVLGISFASIWALNSVLGYLAISFVQVAKDNHMTSQNKVSCKMQLSEASSPKHKSLDLARLPEVSFRDTCKKRSKFIVGSFVHPHSLKRIFHLR